MGKHRLVASILQSRMNRMMLHMMYGMGLQPYQQEGAVATNIECGC